MSLFISFLVAMETNTIERSEKQANQQNYNTHNDKLHNKHTSSVFYTVLARTCIKKTPNNLVSINNENISLWFNKAAAPATANSQFALNEMVLSFAER